MDGIRNWGLGMGMDWDWGSGLGIEIGGFQIGYLEWELRLGIGT